MMSESPIECDLNMLRRAITESLSDDEESQLSAHLCGCTQCQMKLEELAADVGGWQRVSGALRRESGCHLSPIASSVGHRVDGQADSDELSDEQFYGSMADFAVDFLEPAGSPSSIGRLGDIDILGIIGRGGMGIVLKGHQPELNRLVAVKVLAPHLAVSGPARKRFAREAQAAAAILHPNVMPILTVQSQGRLPFIVMPFVACESAQQRIDRDGPFDLLDLLRIGSQTASALAAAHAQGLIHRDVKPANILLEKGVDRVMLTDFGLARAIDDASITRTGVIAGTPQFMSPEQARGEPLDARSDLFSLGSSLYAMATGRPPFRAESTFGILRRITDGKHRPVEQLNSHIPLWMSAFIDRLLEKSPSVRFASAQEVAELLQNCLAHVQQPKAIPLPEPLRTSSIRRRLPLSRTVLGIAGISALLLLGLALLLSQTLRHDGTSRLDLGSEPREGPPTAGRFRENSTDAKTEPTMSDESRSRISDGNDENSMLDGDWDAPEKQLRSLEDRATKLMEWGRTIWDEK